MLQGDWFTLSSLSTFGGVVFAVTLISQFLKTAVDRFRKVRTRLLVLIVAWAVLLGHRYMTTHSLSFEGAYLDILNGFLVALTSMGAHSMAKDNLKWK